MAYIDVAGKTILDAYGKFQAVLYAACVVGDALARDTTNEGFILANATTSIPADAFALEDGAAGDTIWMAQAITIEVRPTESDGVWSDGVLALAADVTDLLYLGDAGKVSDSSGTLVQRVGKILSTTRAFLTPSQYLTTTNLSLSGDLSVTGTLTQTGIATFTAAPVFNASIIIPTGKDFTMTKGNVIFTKGGVQRYVRAITSTGGILVNDDVLLVTPGADVVLTLPDLATAGIGKSFLFIHKATANEMKIAAAGSDKILGINGTDTYVTAADDKGIDVRFTVMAVASALWAIQNPEGDALTMS